MTVKALQVMRHHLKNKCKNKSNQPSNRRKLQPRPRNPPWHLLKKLRWRQEKTHLQGKNTLAGRMSLQARKKSRQNLLRKSPHQHQLKRSSNSHNHPRESRNHRVAMKTKVPMKMIPGSSRQKLPQRKLSPKSHYQRWRSYKTTRTRVRSPTVVLRPHLEMKVFPGTK